MDLWVRNSDRDVFIKANNLFINDDNEIVSFTNIGNSQMTSVLGKYATKERALEVLDEIDNMKCYKYMAELSWNDFIKMLDGKTQDEKTKLFLNMNTYEMPKE